MFSHIRKILDPWNSHGDCLATVQTDIHSYQMAEKTEQEGKAPPRTDSSSMLPRLHRLCKAPMTWQPLSPVASMDPKRREDVAGSQENRQEELASQEPLTQTL